MFLLILFKVLILESLFLFRFETVFITYILLSTCWVGAHYIRPNRVHEVGRATEPQVFFTHASDQNLQWFAFGDRLRLQQQIRSVYKLS